MAGAEGQGPRACLYDVHGNLPALEAVLEDAGRGGVSRYLLGGDYALFGAWPAEAVAMLQSLADATWLRGNGERWTAAPVGAPEDATVQGAIADCRAQLGEDLVERLAQLSEQTVLGGARYCHASPVSDIESFAPTETADDSRLLDGVPETRLIFGHTHVPFRRTSTAAGGRVELINPGSVGMPFDGDPRAAYAIVGDDGAVEHRRVAYDHQAVADALRQRVDADWAGVVAQRIERARF